MSEHMSECLDIIDTVHVNKHDRKAIEKDELFFSLIIAMLRDEITLKNALSEQK